MLLPAPARVWLRQLLGPEARMMREPAPIETHEGWQGTVFWGRRPDGECVVVQFRVMHLAAALVVRAPNEALLDAHGAAIHRLLRGVTFDLLGDEAVALSDLWGSTG